MGRVALGLLVLAAGVQATYMGREWEEQELKEKKMVCCEARVFLTESH